MKALILVDIQKDFCEGGTLAVKDGHEVAAIANRLMEDDTFDLVVATQDWHPSNHGSFASNQKTEPFTLGELNGLPQVWWPDHCTWGSKGAEFHPELNLDKVAAIFRKGMDPSVDSYSGFFDNGKRNSTGLSEYLKGLGVDKVFIMGLATDYCVKFTALDAVKLEFDTSLIVDGCRGVNMNPGDADRAIEDMREASINIISL